ncbi:hypothetical protein A3Q56_01358 [Intoshia linei]|uniref:DNA excision repair protein ERCC-6 n=1 Tax=Intoshia linei TaxID=1819745 RepID=A0A177B9G0_9BILA|nr:hypothetical protein A3Q56_01358 [Intoshia linei]
MEYNDINNELKSTQIELDNKNFKKKDNVNQEIEFETEEMDIWFSSDEDTISPNTSLHKESKPSIITEFLNPTPNMNLELSMNNITPEKYECPEILSTCNAEKLKNKFEEMLQNKSRQEIELKILKLKKKKRELKLIKKQKTKRTEKIEIPTEIKSIDDELELLNSKLNLENFNIFDKMNYDKQIEISENKIINEPLSDKFYFKDTGLDDGNEKQFNCRINSLKENTAWINSKTVNVLGLNVNSFLWEKLYNFQKTCVKWLWELHKQGAGGIVADEMGLGKTIQLIVFFTALYSTKRQISHYGQQGGLGPVLIVCPATLLNHWRREFHKWFPQRRVYIFHKISTYSGNWNIALKKIIKEGHIMIASYCMVNIHITIFDGMWNYVVLDEGHVIRNAVSQTTRHIKMLRAQHRIILTGTPFQNNLVEFWSLFDFVFTNKLGSVQFFKNNYIIPISRGSFTNATIRQVQIAKQCAIKLRSIISPYMIRRKKCDVARILHLPAKDEQILFCKLTDAQHRAYQNYLESDECKAIVQGRILIFKGLVRLRNICNHPCFSIYYDSDKNVYEKKIEKIANEWSLSGKMAVTLSLLKVWYEAKHKVLFFTQSRKMVHVMIQICTTFNFKNLVLTGQTNTTKRYNIVNQFNSKPSIFILIMTTRVGGVGLNLVGADRVIIFDPDWNPSTDMQAKERAWRIGQKKNVIIYRLLTVGTIEEKIYQKQIYKQLLAQRIFNNPDQKRFIKQSDIKHLFSFSHRGNENTDTGEMFQNAEGKFDTKRKILVDNVQIKNVVKIKKIVKKVNSQDYILTNLLIKSGVHSSLEQEKVEELCQEGDIELEKYQAKKIAKQCLTQLKSNIINSNYEWNLTSDCDCKNSFIGQISGYSNLNNSGYISTTSKPTGQSIINCIKSRQTIDQKLVSKKLTTNKHKKLTNQLITFLNKNINIEMTSEKIINQFKDKVSDGELYLFKKLLHEICLLVERKTEPNVWKLRDEYKILCQQL